MSDVKSILMDSKNNWRPRGVTKHKLLKASIEDNGKCEARNGWWATKINPVINIIIILQNTTVIRSNQMT